MAGEKITLHLSRTSHPCLAVEAALRMKGLDYEPVELAIGPDRVARMQEIYGEGHGTIPGMLVGEERVHGSRQIMARLEELAPEPPLFPEGIADEVREAERWGEEEFQDVARRLPYGALHFRPEAAATFVGAPPLDPASTDFAIRLIRDAWERRGISAARLAEDLAALPGQLDHIDELGAAGIVGGETPTAADLQIASTVRVLLTVGDLAPLLEGRLAEKLARRWFPDYQGDIPAGAFPAGWVPAVWRGP